MSEALVRVYRRGGVEGVLRRALQKSLAATVPALNSVARRLTIAGDAIARKATTVGLSTEERAALARNSVLKDCHAGRRCFIIGNGPSLTGQDLRALRGEITFTVTGFWKHPVLEHWQPTYHSVYDPLFFDGSDVMREFFTNTRTRIFDANFLVPVFGMKRVAADKLLPLARTYYIAGAGPQADGWGAEIDLTQVVDSPQSVIQLPLMAAIYMGCSPIYLLGLDHNWLGHLGNDSYFFTGLAGLERHPSIRRLSEWSYRYSMEGTLRLWRGYEHLSTVAERRGLQIVNLTNGGFLDVFPRGRYEDIVHG